MTTPATTDDLLVLQLPESYRASRNVDEIKRAWQTILEREVGRHLEKIKQDVQDFTSAQTKMLNLLATYERDETAELILRRFAQDSLPGLLHLLPGISSGSQLQLPIRLGDDPEGMVDNDTDARSVTMGLEPIVTTRTPPVASMGPPGDSGSVRVARAPVAPMAPAVESESEAGPSSFQEGPNVYLPGDRLQIGKRPLNTAADDSRSSSSPSKKARTNGAGSRCLQVNTSRVWRTIQIWEVHGTDYIFQDDRCGPGYFVIRCNLSEQGQVGVNKPFKFTDAHPLESNEALDHFNNWDLPCHSSTKSYTLDDIIRGFAHRVIGTILEDGLTEGEAIEAMEKLQKELQKSKPSPSKSTPRKRIKAKEKGKAVIVATGSFVPTNGNAVTRDENAYRQNGATSSD